MGIISGSFTGQKTGTYGVDVDWSAETVPASNLSKLTVQVYANYYSIDIGANTCTCTVDGVTKTATAPELHHSGSAVRRLIATFYFDVPHNSDGSKPQCGIYAGFAYNLTSSKYGQIGTLSVSGTVALETIPRASVFTYVPQTVELGSVCYFKWVPASAAFRYQLEFVMGENHGWTAVLHPNTTSEYTHIDTLVLDYFAPWITGKPPAGTVTVTLHTYSDSNCTVWIGSSPATLFTVTVPENDATKPTFTLSAAPKNTPIEGLYIQGRCGISVGFGSVDCKYGAGIAGYAVTVNGVPYSMDGSQMISASGNAILRGTVTDSRGFSRSVELPIYVHPYRKPRVTGFVCYRCRKNEDGTYEQAEDGTTLYLQATQEFDSLGGHNSCALRYRIDSGVWVEIGAEHYISDNTAALYLEGFEAARSYAVFARADDLLGAGDPSGFLIPTANVDFHLRHGGKGAAFGGYAQEEDLLDVWWGTRLRGKLAAESGINNVVVQELRFSENTTVRVPAIGRGIALVAVMSNSGEMGVYLVGNLESTGLTKIDICERIAGSYELGFTVVDSGTIEISAGHAWSYGWYIRNLYL